MVRAGRESRSSKRASQPKPLTRAFVPTRLPLPSPLRPAMPSAARRLHPAGFIAPMLATLAREVPDGPQWAHEIKHDGYRMICRREGDRVRIFSRNALDWT